MGFIMNVLAIIIMFVSVLYYYRQVGRAKKTTYGQQVLSQTSQLTMSAFLLGLGILLIELNAMGLSRHRFVDHLLYYGAFVSFVTSVSLWYYTRILQKEDSKK